MTFENFWDRSEKSEEGIGNQIGRGRSYALFLMFLKFFLQAFHDAKRFAILSKLILDF